MEKLKIVIADDQKEMLCALVRILSRRFEIIASVRDGRYLVETALCLQPDVIVSDVSMPGKTGPQAFKELEALGCRIPFVFITAEPELIRQDGCSVVDKSDLMAELEPAVLASATGEVYLSRRARSLRSTLDSGKPDPNGKHS